MQDKDFVRDFTQRHGVSAVQLARLVLTVQSQPVIYNRALMTEKEACGVQTADDPYVGKIASHVGTWCTREMVREVMVHGLSMSK